MVNSAIYNNYITVAVSVKYMRYMGSLYSEIRNHTLNYITVAISMEIYSHVVLKIEFSLSVNKYFLSWA